ncbi:hypothetical protein EV385_2644 [Krasilnikovia cinnamomea]|uniref:Uncharacterized protein n=2 Tax=Krasilnikovia cinnamomea TaxID=349313 RepID=A0A4Q7ZJ27_9ACTN|nr:hypothetical protein EV385_2644 [Krasilnikovia cinnamomea]
MPVIAGAAAVTAVALGLLLRPTHRDLPGPRAVASLPPASPGVVEVGYVGTPWRLTTVTDGHGAVEIPASTGAWLELGRNAEFDASDGVHRISGKFRTTSVGFDVTDVFSTANAYLGNDPIQVAAITGLGAIGVGPGEQAGHVTILSADREHLTVQAHGVRVTFSRADRADRATGPSDPPGTWTDTFSTRTDAAIGQMEPSSS